MISYVEFYHPWYFLLENVLGLLQYKLMGRMIGGAFAPDEGIEMGVLKFIVRSLTSLGFASISENGILTNCVDSLGTKFDLKYAKLGSMARESLGLFLLLFLRSDHSYIHYS